MYIITIINYIKQNNLYLDKNINWLLTPNHFKSYGDLFCTLYLQFSSDFQTTQCLQWFTEGIIWFENPLYDSSKLHRTTSD